MTREISNLPYHLKPQLEQLLLLFGHLQITIIRACALLFVGVIIFRSLLLRSIGRASSGGHISWWLSLPTLEP